MQNVKIKFCYIGGYELLREGTQTKKISSLDELKKFLILNNVEFDSTIQDPIKLAKSVEKHWKDRHNDGGGSGWIEFD